MPEEPTQALAQFAATLSYDSLPLKVREHCRHQLLDSIACALAGYRGEETPQLAGLAADLGRSRESSVIGGDRLSLSRATLLNGYLITAVTMCDVHRPTMTHVTPEIVPAALAIAERDGASGRDLLVAIAAGSEVTTRIGIGVDYPAFRARGWQGPGVLGPFGAAAAVGRLRGFDAETMARAFGLAGSQAAGTFAAWGTPTVKFHQCRGALSGLLAALLAERSFAATREFLSASDGGLFRTYSDGGRPDFVTRGLGQHWELEQIALRLWPSASLLQGMNTALFDILSRHTLDPSQIEAVRVRLSPTAFDMHGKPARYKGKFEALLSAHYSAAAILQDRSLTLAQFEPTRYEDPSLREFAELRVVVRPDANLTGVQTIVDVDTRHGTFSARCDHPKGSPENPLTRTEIESKIRIYAEGRIPAARIAEFLDSLNRLDELKSVRILTDLLRATPEHGGRAARFG